ncbi:MAG: epoxyqueuosine reductase QueH [Eubacteriales bacterium]|nr:epoxyqueuosine reductase QueH [Eubacteriales bacterium]
MVNYHKELKKLVGSLRDRPRILLHVCCAPCASSCMEFLTKYFDVTLYFYNPNMDSEEEYNKRADELIRLINEMELPSKVKTVIAPYDNEAFEEMAKGLENEPERGGRCLKCYELRLRETARFMESGEYDYFATSLTLSPLKSAEAINTIGEKIAEATGLKYLPTDFKKDNGYKRSIELSKEHDLYRQDYCGCRFSKTQRGN